MGSLGTPRQWWKAITTPSKWLDTTPFSELDDNLVPLVEIEQQQQAAAQAQQADIASKQAAADAIAKAAADKVAADKAKADQEAEAAATLLAKRRRASSAYSQGAQGILGAANVTRKTLLGG